MTTLFPRPNLRPCAQNRPLGQHSPVAGSGWCEAGGLQSGRSGREFCFAISFRAVDRGQVGSYIYKIGIIMPVSQCCWGVDKV